MMGRQSKAQNKLFYTAINLEQRVRKNHILRKVKRYIVFDFIVNKVKDTYGINGNESAAPPIILKMMLLLIFYNVRSERELVLTIPERIDWLWFLEYDLDDDIPNHSVLSKARTRWGVEAFKTFFERIVWQCVQAGLVDGSKIFMDSNLVQADASNNSVVNKESLKRYLNKSYQIFESRLEEQQQSSGSDEQPKFGAANRKYISTTDPDASVTRRGSGKSKLKYQVHRSVDQKREVITAPEMTPGEVHESHRLESLIGTHEKSIETTVETVVADSKYGSIENYPACRVRGIKAHFSSLEQTQKGTGTKKGVFPLHCRCGWRQRLLSRPVEQSPASGLIYLTCWRAISLDFVALWTSFCLAILLKSSAERKSNLIQKIRSIHRNLRLQNIDSGNSPLKGDPKAKLFQIYVYRGWCNQIVIEVILGS